MYKMYEMYSFLINEKARARLTHYLMSHMTIDSLNHTHMYLLFPLIWLL